MRTMNTKTTMNTNKIRKKGFSLFKGYSLKSKKYLLFGVFRKDKELQLEDEVLVSFYNTIPLEINDLFGNNTHYLLNINYHGTKK